MYKLVNFVNREEMYNFLDKECDEDDFEMIRRNIAYGKCMGFYNDDELIGICSVSMYGDELDIYLFEISKYYKHHGYGRKLYYMLLDRFKPSVIKLYPLDDNAEAFWTHLGFEQDTDEDGNLDMISENPFMSN